LIPAESPNPCAVSHNSEMVSRQRGEAVDSFFDHFPVQRGRYRFFVAFGWGGVPVTLRRPVLKPEGADVAVRVDETVQDGSPEFNPCRKRPCGYTRRGSRGRAFGGGSSSHAYGREGGHGHDEGEQRHDSE
jgi:hypothetical protein